MNVPLFAGALALFVGWACGGFFTLYKLMPVLSPDNHEEES